VIPVILPIPGGLQLAGRYELGFDETDVGNVAIIVTELATNMLKHATQGEILMRPIARGTALGMEFVALDRGPGIASLTQCFRDGYSTAGSPGTGLGSIARLAGDFDIYSTPGKRQRGVRSGVAQEQ
jgi:anti-sigma regulatory factor (Ser/Thr protein kinase)